MWIVLAAIVAGNVIVWLNGDKHAQYFQYSIKVRSRVEYYDLIRNQFEKIAADIADSAKDNSSLKSANVESYRNEDFYFIEMKLRFSDTSAALAQIKNIVADVKQNSELKSKYFDRLDQFNALLNESRQLENNLSRHNDSANDASANQRMQIFQAKIWEMNLTRDRDNFEQNVLFYFPASNDYVQVTTGNSAKTYFTATILFLIIGLFIAVAADRFRN